MTDIKMNPEDNNKPTLKSTIINVWRCLTRKNVKLKYILEDKLVWTIIGKDLKIKQFAKMYNGYMYRYKYKFLRPLMFITMYLFSKLNKIMLSSSFIKSDQVSKEKANTIINVWNDTLIQSLKESSLILKKDINGYNNPLSEPYLNLVKTANDIVMQIVYYDTVYRGIFEIFACNLAINLGEEFKDNPTHVLYNKPTLNNMDFLMATERNDGSHLVFNDEKGIIVVPRGNAIRISKQDINEMLKQVSR